MSESHPALLPSRCNTKNGQDRVVLNLLMRIGLRDCFKERGENVSKIILIVTLLCFVIGCTAHYSSTKPDSRYDQSFEVVIGDPQKIFSLLTDIIYENFIVYSYNFNPQFGKLIFSGRGTFITRGDVLVVITLKKVTGIDEEGKMTDGHLLNMTSKGAGLNASLLPQYAINGIRKVFLQRLAEYNLSLIEVKTFHEIR